MESDALEQYSASNQTENSGDAGVERSGAVHDAVRTSDEDAAGRSKRKAFARGLAAVAV